jgi:peptidoglycan hydrolase-like protein with peptidoglycan-binding domain
MRKSNKTIVSGLMALALFATGAIGAQAQTASPQFSLFTSGDLSVGSRGQAVSDLQGILAEMSYLTIPGGTATGYFGELTRSALARYQQANDLPATGYFGPMTRTSMMSQFARNNWTSLFAAGSSNTTVSTASNASTATTVVVNTPGTNMGGSASPVGTLGYWYNGIWTSVDSSTPLRGYYSSNPNMTTSVAMGPGYWYNGVWYPTNTPNIGGGSSASSNGAVTTSSGTYYSSNETSNQTSASTQSGYWYNGSWYSSAFMTSTTSPTGAPGYYIGNNTWQFTDGSTMTYYGDNGPGSTEANR